METKTEKSLGEIAKQLKNINITLGKILYESKQNKLSEQLINRIKALDQENETLKALNRDLTYQLDRYFQESFNRPSPETLRNWTDVEKKGEEE